MTLKLGLWWINRKTGLDEGTELSLPLREVLQLAGALGLSITVRTYVPITVSENLEHRLQNYFKHTIDRKRYKYKMAFVYSE